MDSDEIEDAVLADSVSSSPPSHFPSPISRPDLKRRLGSSSEASSQKSKRPRWKEIPLRKPACYPCHVAKVSLTSLSSNHHPALDFRR